MSVTCSFEVTCWERADFLTLLYVMFSCVFVTFPYICMMSCVRRGTLFVCFLALRPKSTAMVMAGRSVHLTTLFLGRLEQAVN